MRIKTKSVIQFLIQGDAKIVSLIALIVLSLCILLVYYPFQIVDVFIGSLTQSEIDEVYAIVQEDKDFVKEHLDGVHLVELLEYEKDINLRSKTYVNTQFQLIHGSVANIRVAKAVRNYFYAVKDYSDESKGEKPEIESYIPDNTHGSILRMEFLAWKTFENTYNEDRLIFQEMMADEMTLRTVITYLLLVASRVMAAVLFTIILVPIIIRMLRYTISKIKKVAGSSS